MIKNETKIHNNMKHIIWSNGYSLKLKDIVKADNCYLYDSKGNKYIDLESGIWCTCVGHCNHRINNVIKAQISQISHTGYFYCNPTVEKAAKKILEITNLKKGKCEFLSSGSEAVEFSMRIARNITNKPLALTFPDSYFGAYGEASKRDTKKWHIYNWLECSCKTDKKECLGECVEFNKIPFEQIGIFLFEPGSSSGLVRFPPKNLINKIVERIKSNNGLIIVNEVTTGVGRTGKWFGFQQYDIDADVVAIGKGIGNGYPVSVTAISKSISKTLEDTQFLYSQSHQNDPLGASVVKEVVDTISDDNLLDRCKILGNNIVNHLNEIKHTNPLIKEIRGRCLMIAIELTKKAGLVHRKLFERGFILSKRPGVEVLRIDPALTVKEKDIESFLENFKHIIQELNDNEL